MEISLSYTGREYDLQKELQTQSHYLNKRFGNKMQKLVTLRSFIIKNLQKLEPIDRRTFIRLVRLRGSHNETTITLEVGRMIKEGLIDTDGD